MYCIIIYAIKMYCLFCDMAKLLAKTSRAIF